MPEQNGVVQPDTGGCGDFSVWMAAQHFHFEKRRIENYSQEDVKTALSRAEEGRLTGLDFQALLSPAASEFIEPMAVIARHLTRKRFGNIIQMYAPLYLSNECRSECTYCGFSYGNQIRRKTLTPEELDREADILYEQGIRHLLLLTGEDYGKTPVSYIADCAQRIRDRFPSISIEVYPLKEEDYREMRDAGVDGLAVYQETYDPVRYKEVHLRGMKKRMEFRLDCPDRAGRAGMRKIAIGALLGLSDPAAEVYFTAMHAKHLMKRYWQTQIAISLPRLRTAEGLKNIPVIQDADYVRYLFALRLYLPDAGIILSTRETPFLRDKLSELVVTQMSAGSKTDPGGYSGSEADVQFDIEDRRSIHEVRQSLIQRNIEPVFLDWSNVLK